MPSLHPKTVRRVIVLLMGSALLVAIAMGVYAFRQSQIERGLQEVRAEGLAEVERGDYEAGLQSLRHYVSRHQNDAEALYAYGVARARIEVPGETRHIKEAIKTFRTVLDLEPQNQAASKALVDLYIKGSYYSEAIELADKILARSPDDAVALRAKGAALRRSRKWDLAASTYEHLNSVAPTDLESQIYTYEVYRALHKPPEQTLSRAQSMALRHPDDPRFQLLLAVAIGETGDMDRAVTMLRDLAATATPPDAQFVRILSSILERNRLFEESNALLERVASDTNDPTILRVYAQRLWQDRKFEKMAERLRNVDPNSAGSDSALLAYRALALLETGQREVARPILNALLNRNGDSIATAWSTTLETRFADPPLDGRTAVDHFQSAMMRDPDNAIIRYYIGETYDQLGETEPAINAWERAAELAPGWSRPQGEIARAYATTGRMNEAVEHARQGLSAVPQELYANVTYAVVMYNALGVDAGNNQGLLRRVEEIQKREPFEPDTLPIYVSLLARAGERQQAMDVIESLLDQPTNAPSTAASQSATTKPAVQIDQNSMLRLVAVSRSEKLGMEQALLERLELTHANKPTPGLVLARAGVLANQGRPMDGLTLLVSAARHATEEAGPTTATDSATVPTISLPWQLALVEYREYIHDPEVAGEWVTLGETHPADLQVQTAILKIGASVRSDRTFIDRTINRVKSLTGDEGTLWRLERARWLLASNREKDVSEAVTMLNDIVRESPTLTEPRLLLASGLEKVDNANRAIRELQAGIDQQPNQPAIVLELARLEQSLGRFDDSIQRLTRLAATPSDLSPETLRQVCTLMVRQGEMPRAVGLLESTRIIPSTAPAAPESPLTADTGNELLLAQLYRKQGRFAEAQSIYDRLLTRATPEPDIIRAAADFYASRSNPTFVQAALARLSQAQLRPGLRELILADFNEKYGPTREVAGEYYLAATEAAPTDPTVWRELSTFYLRSHQWKAAAEAVDRGLANLNSEQSLTSLRDRLRAIAALGAMTEGENAAHPELASLVDSLAEDPTNPQTLAVVALVTGSTDKTETSEQVTAGLRKLLTQYPRNRATHLELIRRYRALGRLDDAADAAQHAMDLLPDDPAAAQAAVAVFQQACRWPQMKAAAQKWRERSMEDPMPADIAIAQAFVGQNNATAAVDQLQPYINQTQQERPISVVTAYARALVAADRVDDAAALLEPQLASSGEWQRVWLDISSYDLPTAETATNWLTRFTADVNQANATVDQRVMLAAAWQAVGAKFNLPDARRQAREIVTPIASLSDAPPAACAVLAMCDDAAGDVRSAEANYRRAVATSPGDPAMQNNFAYFLLTRDDPVGRSERFAEALQLAKSAVAQSPEDPSFHDTLANAYLRNGDKEAALTQFQRALDLSPELIDALIGKAWTLNALGRDDLARTLLKQVNERVTDRPTGVHYKSRPLSPMLASEVASLRQAVGRSEDGH